MLPNSNGGAFLIEDRAPSEIFTPEDLGEEHFAVARAVDEFWAGELEPRLEAIRRQEPGVAREVLRKSAELGLTGVSIPEHFGGMGMDLNSAIIVAEHLARDGSYAICHEVHTGIGTLPILYFGSEEQKRRYLPKLATAETVAAYALSEPQSGSDALAVRTRADLAADGRRYILNGQKMWITNGGMADLFTVFAKVGGDQFTAFLVERGFPGVTVGKEEHKMGIKGSSTTALYLDNVSVPVENVLGEVGRGHVVAFNILNSGRLKIGVLTLGGAKHVLGVSLKYAKERRAFGLPIAEFGAIQHKLAEMAIRIYAAESALWRAAGLVQSLAGSSMVKAFEEYAVECSIVKVYCSEVYDYAADEGVQIHGGYGYHQDYDVERAYRDSRINRIYEGTNEINRLIIPGMLLKRAARDRLALTPPAEAPRTGDDFGLSLVWRAKQIALLTLDVARRTFPEDVESHQEVLMGIADIIMEVFAMESAHLRLRKFAAGKGQNAADMCKVLLLDAMARVDVAARGVLGACLEGEDLRAGTTKLRWMAEYDPVNAVGLRRAIAGRLLDREGYVV